MQQFKRSKKEKNATKGSFRIRPPGAFIPHGFPDVYYKILLNVWVQSFKKMWQFFFLKIFIKSMNVAEASCIKETQD